MGDLIRSLRFLLVVIATVIVFIVVFVPFVCEGSNPNNLRVPPPSSVTVPKQTPVQAAQWTRLAAIGIEFIINQYHLTNT